jgi:hypothetical protein
VIGIGNRWRSDAAAGLGRAADAVRGEILASAVAR